MLQETGQLGALMDKSIYNGSEYIIIANLNKIWDWTFLSVAKERKMLS